MTSDAIEPQPRPARVGDARTFFGEPIGLAYLAFTEAWERFSYYGMTALLVLYMSEALLLPGHVENIAGFASFRGGLEAVFGPMTTLALASQIFGLYSGFVYFTPVFGGLLADRLIGRRPAVMLGAILMSAGHLAMAFDQSFLAALLLLIVGCGLLKGNISTQVGELYRADDGEGRTRGFAIFSMGINVGAVLGPFVCGLIAQEAGWHAGFGLAGVLMLLGLATYLAGYRHLPEAPPMRRPAEARATLGGREWRIVAALVLVILLSIFQSVAYYQNSNIGLIWIERSVDLDLLGFHIPVAWFNSIDSFASIVFVPVLVSLWRRQAARGRAVGEIDKIAIGGFLAAGANLLLVIACAVSDRVPVLIPIIYDILLGIAFLYYWPTLLALVSHTAPEGTKATMMGAVFLSLFIGNCTIGWIGGLYERMTPGEFWAMHAGIAAMGGVLAVLAKRWLKGVLPAD